METEQPPDAPSESAAVAGLANKTWLTDQHFWTRSGNRCYNSRMLRKPWVMLALIVGCALVVAMTAGPRLARMSRAPLLDVGSADVQR